MTAARLHTRCTVDGGEKKAAADRFVATLTANSQAYHDGTLSYDDLNSHQRALWVEIEAAGPEVKRAVLAGLRNSGVAP